MSQLAPGFTSHERLTGRGCIERGEKRSDEAEESRRSERVRVDDEKVDEESAGVHPQTRELQCGIGAEPATLCGAVTYEVDDESVGSELSEEHGELERERERERC